MANRSYNHSQTLTPGAKARAEQVEAKSSLIDAGFATIEAEIDALAGEAAAAAASAAAASTSETNSSASATAASAAQTAAEAAKDLAEAAVVGFPHKGAVNLEITQGRFGNVATGQSIHRVLMSGAYDAGLWGNHNGGSINSSAKFVNDNSDFGGAGAALDTMVRTLIDAMPRTGSQARYGAEFFVLQTLFGTGTSNPHGTVSGAYQHTVSPYSFNCVDMDGYCTTGLWFRRVNDTANPCVWGNSDTLMPEIALDGVVKRLSASDDMYWSLSDTSWHYGVVVHKVDNGIIGVPWPLYGNDVNPGGMQVALGWIVQGKVDATVKWKSPIPGTGEVLMP